MSGEGTFHEALHPLFITSKKVTTKGQIIDTFLKSAADGVTIPENYEELHAFTLQRAHADAQREKERVESEGLPMRGTRPPVGDNPTLDFEGVTLDELARYVLENFAADEVERRGDQYVETIDAEARIQKTAEPNIDNDYFVVLDERSARDQSALVVYIPRQGSEDSEGSGKVQYTRNWIHKDDYTNSETWEEDEDDNEMKAVRIAFKEAYRIEMLKLGEEGIDEYADQVDENGVFSEESRQEWARKADEEE